MNGVRKREIMRQTGHKSAEMFAKYNPDRRDIYPQRRRRPRYSPEEKGFPCISGC
jgi:hypothetical protein